MSRDRTHELAVLRDPSLHAPPQPDAAEVPLLLVPNGDLAPAAAGDGGSGSGHSPVSRHRGASFTALASEPDSSPAMPSVHTLTMDAPPSSSSSRPPGSAVAALRRGEWPSSSRPRAGSDASGRGSPAMASTSGPGPSRLAHTAYRPLPSIPSTADHGGGDYGEGEGEDEDVVIPEPITVIESPPAGRAASSVRAPPGAPVVRPASIIEPPTYDNDNYVTLAVGSLDAWLRDVARLQVQVRLLHRDLLELDAVQRSCLTLAHGEPWVRAQSLADALQSRIAVLRSKISELDLLKTNFTPSDHRAATQQEKMLLGSLLDATNQFRNLQNAHADRTRDFFQRQLRIAKPDASAEEVEWAMSSGAAPTIFSETIVSERERRNTIRNRHRELLHLDKSIHDLTVMANDLAHFVAAQDEQIMTIAQFAEETAAGIEAGARDVDYAVDSARKARRKKWILLCLGLVLVLAVVGLVLGITLPNISKAVHPLEP
ncbi:Plasma membrane t-SNARE, secretory vesicle fusion [Blastocladiella emersonii ATCC 22665]|nr:Plasma membrane t-SNARE, secretory vesicle fusion [Blastocladiella emersonii ATCC 22665]